MSFHFYTYIAFLALSTFLRAEGAELAQELVASAVTNSALEPQITALATLPLHALDKRDGNLCSQWSIITTGPYDYIQCPAPYTCVFGGSGYWTCGQISQILTWTTACHDYPTSSLYVGHTNCPSSRPYCQTTYIIANGLSNTIKLCGYSATIQSAVSRIATTPTSTPTTTTTTTPTTTTTTTTTSDTPSRTPTIVTYTTPTTFTTTPTRTPSTSTPSPTETTTSNPNPTPTATPSSSISNAALIGGTIGGVASLITACIGLYWCLRGRPQH